MIISKPTLFIGKVIHYFEALPSTNAYAIDYLSKNKPSEGTVISASNQTEGKGQHGSIWESSANQNLTLSIILYPMFLLPRHQFWLSQAIALGVCDFIADKVPEKKVWIKWSNDIYIENRKVAGILIQNAINHSAILNTVVGIGINVNQTLFGFEGARKPTSLKLETDREFNLKELLTYLFWYIEVRYLQLKANKVHQLQLDYMDVLYQYQKTALYARPNGEQFYGKIEGVAPAGQLVINKSGKLLHFNIKEVQFL